MLDWIKNNEKKKINGLLTISCTIIKLCGIENIIILNGIENIIIVFLLLVMNNYILVH